MSVSRPLTVGHLPIGARSGAVLISDWWDRPRVLSDSIWSGAQVVLPCRHLAVCAECAKVLAGGPRALCPVCRGPIADTFNVFL